MAAIREAIVLTGPGDGTRTVAGVPLLVRTIVALQRAGVARCLLVGVERVPADPRVRCVVTAAATLAAPGDDALRLVVGAGAVIDATLVRELAAHARAGEVVEVEAGGARVRVAPGSLVGRDGGRRVQLRAGTLCPASTPAADLEREMLRRLENPRDGYLDRLLHRRLSRPLTRLLLRMHWSPNAVTVVGIVIGVAGGLLLARPGTGAIVLAVLCLLASGVLDCCDGEVARLALAESRLGHWLDLAGDTVVHVAVLAAVVLRLAAAGGVPGGRVLALLGSGVLGAFAVVTWSEETAVRRERATGWENRVLDGLLSPLTTRDWYLFVVGFAVAGRLDALVTAAAIGAQVFWVGMLVVLLRVLRRV